MVPSSLRAFPDEGGLYIWTKNAFGDWHGFLCAWLYFDSSVLFFPTLLLAGVSMASYMFGPGGVRYAESSGCCDPRHAGRALARISGEPGGVAGGKMAALLGGATTYAIALLLCASPCLAAWRFGSATHFHFVPEASWGNLNFWSQIALAMTGLELAPILGGEIYNPAKNVPRAAWISCIACAAFYIAGTAALLVLLPPERISALTGLAQAGEVAGQRFGATWLSACFAGMITVGFIGQLSTYIAGNTRLPFTLGIDHYMPAAFARLHPRWNTPACFDPVPGRARNRVAAAGATGGKSSRRVSDPGGYGGDLHFDSAGLHFRLRLQVRPALGGRRGRIDRRDRCRSFRCPARRRVVGLAIRIESDRRNHPADASPDAWSFSRAARG